MSNLDHDREHNLIDFSDESVEGNTDSSGELYSPEGVLDNINNSLRRADDVLGSARYFLRSNKLAINKVTSHNTDKMSTNFTPIERALTYVPNFDGVDSDESFRFFRACDFAIKMIDPKEMGSLIQGILIKLSGKALGAIRYKEITTYSELKKILGELTNRKWTLAHLQTKLVACRKMRDEDIQTYFDRIDKLHHDIVDANLETGEYSNGDDIRKLLQNQVLTVFIDGLPESYRTILKSQKPKSLEEALAIAMEEEVALQSSRETRRMVFNNSESSQKKSIRTNDNKTSMKNGCYKCGRTNHIARDCRAPVWEAKQQQPRQYTDNQRTAGTSRSLVICGYCKKEGHRLEECRKRQRVNAKRNEEKSSGVRHSGNEKTPDAAGRRPVGQIKTATLSMRDLSVSNQH
jgi:hypothetical protein